MSVPRASHPTGLGRDLIIMFQEAPREPGCYVDVLRNTLGEILCLCLLAVCAKHMARLQSCLIHPLGGLSGGKTC